VRQPRKHIVKGLNTPFIARNCSRSEFKVLLKLDRNLETYSSFRCLLRVSRSLISRWYWLSLLIIGVTLILRQSLLGSLLETKHVLVHLEDPQCVLQRASVANHILISFCTVQEHEISRNRLFHAIS